MTPTFTVLIGSIGRASLIDTLNSIHRQRREPGDQVIVAIDTFEDTDRLRERRVTALVKSYGAGFDVCAYDSGYHWFGIEQINHAMKTVPMTGSHIFTLGDDDVFVDGAYAELRPRLANDPTQPILYKFLAPWREFLWDVPQMRMSRISGCCIAAPKQFVGPFPTRQYVEHDFDWMQAILRESGRDPLWLDKVLVIARPEQRGRDVTHRGIVRCWHCKDWRYQEDVNVLDPRCPKCAFVIQVNEPIVAFEARP
jgi:hypothetical protein